MRLFESFDCDVYRNKRVVQEKMTEVSIVLDENPMIEVGQVIDDLTNDDKREHFRSVFYGFETHWVEEMRDMLSNWLSSERILIYQRI